MRNLVLIFFGLVFFQGCSTTLMTDDKYHDLKIDVGESLKGKDVSVRVFHWTDREVSSFWEKDSVKTKILKNPDLQNSLNSILKSEKGLSGVQLKDLSEKEKSFILESVEKNDEVKAFLLKEIKSFNSDFHLDVYTYFYQTGVYHPYIEFIWMIVHGASVGLIPYYQSEKIEVWASLYDQNQKLLKHFKVNNQAGKWMWSPNYFRDGAKKIHDESFHNSVSRNALKKVLQDAFIK